MKHSAIKAARRAAQLHGCKFEWVAAGWILRHESGYISTVSYKSQEWTPEQVKADAERMAAIYRDEHEKDDPGADPLRITDNQTWFAKWFADRIVKLPEPTYGARMQAIERWCRETIGPYMKEWTNQPGHLRFRQEKNRVLFALIMRDFYDGGPLDPGNR
jgi:hypothetical protein